MRKLSEYLHKTMTLAIAVMLVCTVCACGGDSGTISRQSGSKAAGDASTAGTAGATEAAAGTTADEGTTYKDVINIAVNQESPTLDLQKTGTLVARHIANGTIYEKLMTLNGAGEPVPELCESVDVNEDSSEFVFHLRQGVKFHDGSEMTAEDVVASMNRWIENFANARALTGDSRFEIVDDYTCKITLANSCATFLTAISGGTQPAAITTAEACEEENESGYLVNYIGTGPYKFENWELNQYITLTKFEDYQPYGDESEPLDGLSGYKHAYAEKLVYYYVPDEATRLAGLQTGQYDIMFNLSADNYDVVNNMEGLTTQKAQDGILVMVCNKKEGPMSNPVLRQAINAQLNCEELLAAGYGSFYSLGSCYMDEAQGAWVTEAGSSNYNMDDSEKAKELLKEAGYDGETVKVMVPNIGGFTKTAEMFRQQMEEIGVNVELNIVDFATSTELKNDSTVWDLWLISFSSVPLPSQKTFVSPTYAGWSVDDTLTGYLNDFNTAATLDEAKATWEAMQAYCLEDYLPALMLGHYESSIGYSEKLEGLQYYMGAYFWNARVAE